MAGCPSPSVWKGPTHHDRCGKSSFSETGGRCGRECWALRVLFMAYEYNIYTIYTICTHVWVHNIFLPKDAVISVTYLDKILLKAGDDFFL